MNEKCLKAVKMSLHHGVAMVPFSITGEEKVMKHHRFWGGALHGHTMVLVTVLLLAAAAAVSAAEEKAADGWRTTITPYIWLPSIRGSMKLEPPPGLGSGRVDSGPGNYLENLNFTGMLDLQMQKGRWTLLTDIIYLDFSDTQTAKFPGVFTGGGGWTTAADWDLQALVFELSGAYSVFRNGYSNFDLLAGVRYAEIDGEVKLDIFGPLPDWVSSRNVSETEGFVDPIIGFKGKFELGKKWYLPYYFDIGGFSIDSDLTLQAFTGIGYHFNDWFSAVLGYVTLTTISATIANLWKT